MNTIVRELHTAIGDAVHEGRDQWFVLDPFGGVGGIFDIHALEWDYDAGELQFNITCIEIEEPWAEAAMCHDRFRNDHDVVHAMDFFDFAMNPKHAEAFDIIITSPTYGNRMADHHTPSPEDTSTRNTYRHKLGRELSEGSSASMQWGTEYRQFHMHAWHECLRLLEPGGLMFLNVKDHIRKGVRRPVVAWHRKIAKAVGFELVRDVRVAVNGNRQGENHEVRVDHEHVMVFRRPWQISMDAMGEAEYAAQKLLKGGE